VKKTTARAALLAPLFALTLIVAHLHARADSGVLIPRDRQQPDPAILSLQEMQVEVVIDNGDARVFIRQIFANHTASIEEGTYVFALPSGSTVSDFAVWDGPVRIPAVILERRRAEEIYDQARMQAIDPGLLAAGERDGANPAASSVFSAKIVPIPAFGTKRLEIEYHQRLTATDFQQGFVLPLQPSAYQEQRAGHFRLRFELRSAEPIADLQFTAGSLPLKIAKQDAHTVVGTFAGDDVAFAEDFAAKWKIDPSASDKLEVTTYRNPHPALPLPDETAPQPATAPEPGFFLAQVLIGAGNPKAPQPGRPEAPPRNVVVLFDNSLSMQWEKLERSYAAMEKLLRSLGPSDHFNLLLFNQDVSSFQPLPVAATPANIEAAFSFVRGSGLRGGTDLGKALAAALAQCALPDSVIVLLTDGQSDRGTTVIGRKIAADYARRWKDSAQHPMTDIFAVGDDANLPLLRQIARNDGVLEHVISTEPVDAKLASFLFKIANRPVEDLQLAVDPRTKIHTLYPLDDSVYAGSIASWVGDYPAPAKKVGFTLRGLRDGAAFSAQAKADLPDESLDHPQLPRLWAQARVDALLDQIAREGESRAAIDEIIRLSRKYKFVTPYTSFLAVPRSLLRPRVIRPGDPVLRVHTDPSIESVIALFPFGLTKPLRHLPGEDGAGPEGDRASDRVWETRFLAPAEMRDGTYSVRLILRDAAGRTYRESKSFVIASTPPQVKILLDKTKYRRGDLVLVKAEATASTRTLTAQMEGASPVDLRWDAALAASAGQLRIPGSLAPGNYTLSVTAEDIAHNMGTQEVQLEILP
jgi:Ca-activated chloride channel family protein